MLVYPEIVKEFFFRAKPEKWPLGKNVFCVKSLENQPEKITLAWCISADGKVERSYFQAWGNPAVIALCQWLGEQVVNLPVDSLKNFEAAHLAAALQLPAQRIGSAVLVANLIGKMLEIYSLRRTHGI